MRIGAFKLVRQGLKTKRPGDWQVYDLSTDQGEQRDLARSRADLIRQAEEILRREVAENQVFPLAIPGVTLGAATPATGSDKSTPKDKRRKSTNP